MESTKSTQSAKILKLASDMLYACKLGNDTKIYE